MEQRALDNIVVVGGGTAGWLSALYAQIVLPTSKITVVESKDIGILGAGEGTVPDFIHFTDFLGIPISRLVRDADATIKNSIKFTNWTGDGSHFHHSFYTEDNLGLDGCNILHPNMCQTNIGIILNTIRQQPLDQIDIVDLAGRSNKAAFTYNGSLLGQNSNPIFDYDIKTRFALHFNAVKLAGVLRSIGEERGIKTVDAKVLSVEKNHNKDIVKLNLDSNSSIPVDFMFDCTGFGRVFIGKEFDAEWVSHSKTLTVSAAVPFFLPLDSEQIPAYTESIAMKYGWMWVIPTRERYGCGYVYDSSMISEEEAIAEIEEHLGFAPEYPRKDKGGFKFEAGYYTTPWVNNCVAIGLSGGFIEPLEATSIWVTTQTLQDVLSNANNMRLIDPRPAAAVNKKFVDRSRQVLDFIYYHYMSGRKDTPFWEHYNEENAPDSLKELIEKWKYSIPEYTDFTNRLFVLNSWMMIARGKNQIDIELAKSVADVGMFESKIGFTYDTLVQRKKEVVDRFVSHGELLKRLANEV